MKESLMKEWNAHERNEDKEVEILDFNDKQKKKRRDKTKTSTRGAKYEQSRQMQTPRKAKNERRTTTRNKEYAIVTYVFLALFICMTGWIIYFMQFKSEDFINNSYNARLAKLSDYTVRGDILANDGTVLATTMWMKRATRLENILMAVFLPMPSVIRSTVCLGWNWMPTTICSVPMPLS